MKCACERCLCIVNIEDAVQNNGQYYCCDACANGHPKEGSSCGNS
ncbi:MAG: metallothionein, partial [Elainellaceae cyanobacterium]